MDSYDEQQHILSNDNDSKVELVDTAARQKENMAQWASHMQYQSVDLKNEDALLKSDQGKLVPSQTPPEARLRDELLRERARLQKLVKERDQLKETRRLQKEIEELRRQLDDIDLADIGKPAESKFSPRGPENILECPASESHIRKIDINMPNEMTNSEPALRDELLHERARLQRLVEEHHKLLETRVLRKEIKELYRLLDDVEVVDMWNPVIPEYGTRTHDHVQDLRAIESLDENVNLNDFTDSLEDDPQGGTNQDAVDVESKDGTLTVPRTIYSRINGQGATEEHIKPDEVPGRRHESFSEKEDSEVSGGPEPQTFDAVGTLNWLRKTLPDISTYNRRSMKGVMRYITILKNEGMSYMQNAIQNDLDGWKHMEFSVALVGDAGAGKSSLINAILGLTADDEGAAQVGSTETTLEAQKYVHPKYKNVAFFDLPGIGTPTFPREEYLRKIDLDMYDFFLIVSRGRFRDNDKWFAKMIQKKNLQLYFVRTCIDHDIVDNEKAHPKKHNQRRLIAEIREDIKSNLLKAGLNEEKIHIALVNNHNILEHDFSDLMKELIKNAPDIKREAVMYALFSRSKEVIETKVTALRERMNKTALIGSVGSLVPIPGVGEAIEIVAIYKETQFYRQQLQIDDKSLEKLAKNMNKDLNELKQNADIKSNILFASTQSLVKFLAICFASEAVESVIKISIPFIGSIISAFISFPVCKKSLEKVLALCEKEAYALNKEVEEWLSIETQV